MAVGPIRTTRTVGIHTLTDERFDRPILDDGFLLWFGDHWSAVSDLQVPVVQLLIRNLGRTVAQDVIVTTYRRSGGSTREKAVLSLMRRLAGHFTAVGLEVEFGYRFTTMTVRLP